MVVTNWHRRASLASWFESSLPIASDNGPSRLAHRSTQLRRLRLHRPYDANCDFIDDAKHQTLMSTKTTIERGRITARVPQPVVDELEEAAALVGVTVNQFIVQAATERARAVIETYTRIDLSRRDAAFILQLLDQPAPANRSFCSADSHATIGHAGRAWADCCFY